ncbi:hypothetical protein [Diaphorobacter sp.]|uniref:hypothetical protein n=1 Tax=Diaphorobacter sp. TaxID=1934310 RepID=UPI0028B1FC45|nr:hypothetical protein [Diaphorobacter sp.]
MSVEIYKKFLDALENIQTKTKYVPYDWDEIPRNLHFCWAAYSQMLDEFSREISNILNGLTRYTRQLAAWSVVAEGMDENEFVDVIVEFVEPLATLALNMPHVINSRFLFAAAHLCHQASQAKEGEKWVDQFPMDSEVYKGVADKYGANWHSYQRLKLAMEKIANRKYRTDTQDFRNSYNHRFSVPIGIGISLVVTRTESSTTGGVSYGFGERDSLKLPHIVSLLEDQCQKCYSAFECFQNLVREHGLAIAPHNRVALGRLATE